MKRVTNLGLLDSTSNENSALNILWPNVRDDYKILRSVGQGATSNVYEAVCLTMNERKCAVKIINLEKCNSSTLLEEIKREIKSMRNMKNDNIVIYYASFVKGPELFIIMDLCQKGSLLDIIKCIQANRDIKNGVFDENTIATILKDVLKGLSYIHDNGLVHRDLKCGNLLVKDDGVIQIADFGVAAFLAAQPMQATGSSLDNKRFTFVGTPCWMAPEVMQQVKGHNQKADIWSFGITAIELAAGQAPYAKYSPMKVLMLTLKNDSPDIDTSASTYNQYSNYGQKYRKFIKACLNKEPILRPSAKELQQSSFIKSKSRDRESLCKMLFTKDTVPFVRHKSEEDLNADNLSIQNYGGEWNFDIDPLEDHLNDLENLRINQRNSEAKIQITYRITLRKRNKKKNNELEDISFEYMVGKDSVDILVRELVEADLLDGCDLLLVAHNMSEIVANPSVRERIFALNSLSPNGIVQESDLYGYAKLLLRYTTDSPLSTKANQKSPSM